MHTTKSLVDKKRKKKALESQKERWRARKHEHNAGQANFEEPHGIWYLAWVGRELTYS